MTNPAMQETCDMLLDYMEAVPNLSEDEQSVLYDAWEQQDLYPCASGVLIRIAINAEAIEQVGQMYERRQKAAAAITSIAAATRERTVYVVTQTPVNRVPQSLTQRVI